MEFFNQLDTNKDGELSYNEMTNAFGEPQDTDLDKVKTKTEKAFFLMTHYDKERNGYLGFNEVKALLADVG
jgi:Ca2+-binding EF-hand superfamily protein